MALEESEPLGHGHYPIFIIDIGLEFYSLSNPETLAIMSSKEGGDPAKKYISASSKKHGNSRQ